MINVDELIQAIVEKRDLVSAKNAEIDILQEEKSKLEAKLMQAMREMNTTQLGSIHGTASLKVTQKPIVQDWNEFNKWILSTGNLQLLQKRISNPAYAEIINTGDAVPGVELFEQDTVSIRRK